MILTLLRTHLIKVRQEGVAFDDEEWGLGIRSVAAGVKDGNGKVIAAIGTAVPSVRLTFSRMNELASIVKNCADEISKELGFLTPGQP